MKKQILLALLLFQIYAAHAAWFTNSVSVDSFVRVAAPGSNYGGAGSLSVSGSTATNGSGVANGAFDSFIRFNTAALLTNFNSLFGTNNWAVNGARLRVTEVAAPNNALFNRGVGAFEIRWIANDSWTEGTGNPNTPTTTGITYNDEPALLNVATDATLGTFTNAGADGTFSFELSLPTAFVSDIASGGEVGVFFTAISQQVGFTFNSRSFGTATLRPYLEISAVLRPVITGIALSGEDVLISATNGVAGGTYYVLSATNVAQPLNVWNAIATNQLSADGEFITTLTNAASAVPAQFFMLRTQ